jgi:hypothetical protein
MRTTNSFYLMIGLVVVSMLAVNCEEKMIMIPNVTVGRKHVLVEELTGVRCPQCPNGTVELTRLDDQFGENLIIVSNHSAGSFSIPMTSPASAFDFRNQDFRDIAALIGTVDGYPAASIDRKVFSAEPSAFAITASAWGSYIAAQSQEDPGMDLFVINSYDESTRELKATVRILPTLNQTDQLHLSVMITQDSIVDAQTVGPEKVPDYVHRHVLRKVLTKPDGELITEPMVEGTSIERVFTFVLPTDFEAKHCAVVAAVHGNGVPNKTVRQAAESHVKN